MREIYLTLQSESLKHIAPFWVPHLQDIKKMKWEEVVRVALIY